MAKCPGGFKRQGVGEVVLVKGPIPEAARGRLDALCWRYWDSDGLSFGQTMAACLLLGIRELESLPVMPASISAAVRS